MMDFLRRLLALLLATMKRIHIPIAPSLQETMPGHFERALTHVLGIEGGYSDDPDDRGGATQFGISERLARDYGYGGQMRDLTVNQAREIYRRAFWEHHRLPCARIAEWHYPAALELFDTAVNMGIGWAPRFFQLALNALNRNGKLYPDIEVDGWVGDRTLACLEHLQGDVEKRQLVKMVDCQQGVRYLAIMLGRDALGFIIDLPGDPTQEKFARGWFDKRVGAGGAR